MRRGCVAGFSIVTASRQFAATMSQLARLEGWDERPEGLPDHPGIVSTKLSVGRNDPRLARVGWGGRLYGAAAGYITGLSRSSPGKKSETLHPSGKPRAEMQHATPSGFKRAADGSTFRGVGSRALWNTAVCDLVRGRNPAKVGGSLPGCHPSRVTRDPDNPPAGGFFYGPRGGRSPR